MAPSVGLEDLDLAVRRIRDEILGLIGRTDVTVARTERDQSELPGRAPDQVFVYAEDARSVRGLGHPLVFTATCPDPSAWTGIDLAFDKAGFDKIGPRDHARGQAYASRNRAWLIVPAHPGATRAVDMTGKVVVGWIVKP